MLTRVDETLEIQATPANVFRCLDDPRLVEQWLEGLEQYTLVPPHSLPHAIGTEIRQQLKEGSRSVLYTGVVTDYEPGRHFGLRLWCEDYVLQTDYRLTPIDGGTRLRFTSDSPHARWRLRIQGWLLGWIWERRARQRLRRLRRLAETGSAG